MKNKHTLTSQKYLHHWWIEYQWSVISLLVVVAFALGFLGFCQYFAASGEARTGWDILYLTLQLFTLDSGVLPGSVPWSLEIARLLAPALLAYTAGKALLEIFREQIQLFRARFARDHVIICGLGRKGQLLARSFREAGYKVVAIELNKVRGNIGQARQNGTIVLNGNASDAERLRRARVDRASYLFSVCGDNSINAEVAVHSRKLVKGLEGRGLTCFIHINDSGLTGLLHEREIATQQPDAFRLELFNISQRGVQSMLNTFPPFTTTAGDRATHSLLVVGAGCTGQSLIIQTARQWNLLRDKSDQRISLTLVDVDAEAVREVLLVRHQALNGVMDIDAQEIRPESAQFHKADFLQDEAQKCRFDQIFICLDDEERAMVCALALRQKLLCQGIPIIVQLMHDQGVAALMRGEAGGEQAFDDIYTFGLIENSCTPDLLLGGTHELLARAIHDNYLREQIAKGETREENSSLVSWDELPESLKNSNRRQADHIGVKLKRIGRGITPLKNWNAALDKFKPEDIEALAELEHDRWVEERKAAGWQYKAGDKDIEKKTSPHLVSWGGG